MNRTDFVKGIIGFIGVAALPKNIEVKRYQRIYLLQSFIRGFRFYEGPNLLGKMQEGDMLQLIREPKNEHDSCAIALYFNEKKVGFLPRENNEMLSKLMDAEIIQFQAEITHLKPEAQAWENVHIVIYVLKELHDELPKEASYLTTLNPPRYHSLKLKNDQIATIYLEEDDEEIIDIDSFYQKMVDNSSNDGIFDILHSTFESSENLEEILSEGRLMIKYHQLPKDLKEDKLTQAVREGIISLENIFGDEGYIVANVNRVAELSQRIEKVVAVTDKFGRNFYEIRFA